MKKISFFLFALLCMTQSMSAQNVSGQCYRGFADAGYTFGIGDYDFGRLEINTSHGYQINPYIFLGAGVGLHFISCQSPSTPTHRVAKSLKIKRLAIFLFQYLPS